MSLFASPEYLVLLLLLLPLGVLVWLAWRIERQDRQALGDQRLIGLLLHAPAASRRGLRTVLLLIALLFIVVALARPRLGVADEQLRRKGLQIMLVLDGSLSMAVEDVHPNRLEESKYIMLNLFDRMDGSQFGLVVFGQSSHVQFPLTSDLAAARNLVAPLSVEALNSPGSNIAAAIQEAMRSFVPGQTSGRAIVLLSDGGDPEQDDPPGSAVAMARRAAAAGIQVHTIGVGTVEGDRIPFYDQGGQLHYMEDGSGHEVISRLNEQLLGQIASVTGGTYFRAAEMSLGDLVSTLEEGALTEITDRVSRSYEERFQLVVAVALLLLISEYMLLGRGGGL